MVYGNDSKEEMPGNIPHCQGKGITMSKYVDIDHAGDFLNRLSRTGFLVFLNCTCIFWMSKKQTSIETSFFWYEFTAMKQCNEYVISL